MPKKTKKRNPQDLTLRNLRALKTRIATLEERIDRMVDEQKILHDRLSRLDGTGIAAAVVDKK